MELTDLTVSNLKPPLSGQKSYWDKNLRGFGIRISAGGAKSWVVQVGPQRKLITLARYPTVSLKEARIAGKRHLAAPVDLTRSISLDAALELFLAHCRATLRPRTVHSYKTTLYRHLTERNGRLRSQTTDRVMATVTSLAATPAEQLHFFNYARTFFGFCVRRKLLQINPLADLPSPAKRNTRHRVLTDQELKAVWLAADQDDTPLARIIQICILTGIRRGEVSKMEWSYFSHNQQTIDLTDILDQRHRDYCIAVLRSRWGTPGVDVCGAGGR